MADNLRRQVRQQAAQLALRRKTGQLTRRLSITGPARARQQGDRVRPAALANRARPRTRSAM